MTPTLYNISTELSAILAAIEEAGGEITPEIEEALAISEGQFTTKSEEYGHAILNLEAMAAAAKAEKERLANLQKFYDTTVERLRTAMIAAMKATGKEKVETPTMRLSLRHTTATEVDDIALLPSEFKTTKVEEVADKTAIKKAIQSGEDVPGAHLVDNVSLQIK